jgi:hypothetical protein
LLLFTGQSPIVDRLNIKKRLLHSRSHTTMSRPAPAHGITAPQQAA